jgi:hypothetical protein
MPGGKTLAHILNVYRYGKVSNVTFIIDEIGLIPLSTWARIGAWSLMGAKFILLGDFRGQFEPIADCWRGPTSRAPASCSSSPAASTSICRPTAGPRATTTTSDFYTGLYPLVKDPDELPRAVLRAQAAYPWTDAGAGIGEEICDLALVVSHPWRMRLNQYYNETRDKREGAVLVRCNETVSSPQQAAGHVAPLGMRLLCCCKSHATLVNGVFYTVEDIDRERVVVRMCRDYHPRPRRATRTTTRPRGRAAKAEAQEGPIELSHRDASVSLRLSHCLCYASVQGFTLRDTSVLMLDTRHQHFTMRSLIVGASRVTAARNLHVATEEQASGADRPGAPARPQKPRAAWLPRS